jgi:hypothetical protein
MDYTNRRLGWAVASLPLLKIFILNSKKPYVRDERMMPKWIKYRYRLLSFFYSRLGNFR